MSIFFVSFQLKALAEAFSDRSALLRHEVAYIMGQMVNPASTTSLTQVSVEKERRKKNHKISLIYI